MKDILANEIRSLASKTKSSQQNQIDDVIAYTRAASFTLKVFNGKDAVQLLLRSKRILTDLSFAELVGGDKFDLQVIIREWCPKVLPEWEFRLFVMNGQLNACSQYYSDCYVPEMHANREVIKKVIMEYFEKNVKGRLPGDINLTVDLAVDPNLKDVTLIEVGNPPPVAGTALYNWQNEKDKSIIMKYAETEKDMDLRILSALPSERWETLHRIVKEVICQERGLKMEAFNKKKGGCIQN
eukprot:TRINITY_DN14240_c0_g1_i3.p1 TRINITY_DN14240_c0_g1~~TRINITY_DN14240_c0_g1_i3.p1  ORF type:complete len:240 (+),score=36.52 TRINITY_DN14240_c0_g1_i3:505-1224(+)